MLMSFTLFLMEHHCSECKESCYDGLSDRPYAHFHNLYLYTQTRKSLEELKTLDIGTRMLDNAAFVRIHEVERFSKDFSEVEPLTSRGFRL